MHLQERWMELISLGHFFNKHSQENMVVAFFQAELCDRGGILGCPDLGQILGAGI